MPSVVSTFRLAASARVRRSTSLNISRAQLMSSSCALVIPFLAQIKRCAQAASMASVVASLSTPRIRNGPVCWRGAGATSRAVGKGGGTRLIGFPPSCALSCAAAATLRHDRRHGSHARRGPNLSRAPALPRAPRPGRADLARGAPASGAEHAVVRSLEMPPSFLQLLAKIGRRFVQSLGELVAAPAMAFVFQADDPRRHAGLLKLLAQLDRLFVI